MPLRFADISALGKLRVSGEAAPRFITTMFTADTSPLDEIGGVTASLLLNGEGGVIDLVSLIRTGDVEYMVVTDGPCRQEAYDWLSAHSELTDDAGAVFPGLAVTDESPQLACIALFGEGARAVLTELAGAELTAFPHTGALTMAQLDTVAALILSSPALPGESYEVFCPPAAAEGLIYAFMSFPEIAPATFDEYAGQRVQAGTWFTAADSAEYVFPDEAGLGHLLRPSADFVGAQAVSAQRGKLPCQPPAPLG
jgi:glycine cleavage system aminomethyltransferase T